MEYLRQKNLKLYKKLPIILESNDNSLKKSYISDIKKFLFNIVNSIHKIHDLKTYEWALNCLTQWQYCLSTYFNVYENLKLPPIKRELHETSRPALVQMEKMPYIEYESLFMISDYIRKREPKQSCSIEFSGKWIKSSEFYYRGAEFKSLESLKEQISFPHSQFSHHLIQTHERKKNINYEE